MGGDVGIAQARSLMSVRLALGTVQFGLTYGIANKTGQVAPAEVKAILTAAREAGLDTLDTAIGYGTSEVVLGGAGVASWRIVTKLPGFTGEKPQTWVPNEVQKSLDRLGADRLHALMLHRPSDLLGPGGRDLYQSLVALRDESIVSKIGYSIYGPSELDGLFESYPADIVQAPFNAFDRRLVTSGWLQRLTDRGVEIHTRSAFLQGLLLLDPASRPAKFSRWAGLFERWDQWCSANGGDRLGAALSAVLQQSEIDRVVVGIDSLAQLQQILLTFGQLSIPPPATFAVDDDNLLNPARWNNL